jgi:putative SOS response-associated peptidase YedK
MTLHLKQQNEPASAPGGTITVVLPDDHRKPVSREMSWVLAPVYPFRDKVLHPVLQRKRCVVPIEGFILSKSATDTSFCFFYTLYKKRDMMLAAYEVDGVVHVMTMDSNLLVKPLSERMPVVLRTEDLKTWLDPMKADLEAIEALIKELPVDALTNVRIAAPDQLGAIPD